MENPVTIGNATLYLGDCREILPTLGRVDAVVTDPPYGIGENEKSVRSRVSASPRLNPKRSYFRSYGNFDWDRDPPPAWLLGQLRDISRHQIIFGGNFFDLPPSSCWLIWDKQNSGDFADCEMAWTNLDNAARLIQWRWNGMIRKGSDVREHPTQKPEGVMKWCLDKLPADVATVLDPFMGSGTTGVAAIQRGLKFIGIEINQQYFDVACRRIADAVNNPDMLVEAGVQPKQESWDEMWSRPYTGPRSSGGDDLDPLKTES